MKCIDFDKVVRCINSKTYGHNDSIEKYTTYISQNVTDVTKETMFTEDITTFSFGKSYSIKTSYNDDDGYSLGWCPYL